jgi:hypothetical protein
VPVGVKLLEFHGGRLPREVRYSVKD